MLGKSWTYSLWKKKTPKIRILNGIQCYCQDNWDRKDKGSLKAKRTLEYFQNNPQKPVFQVKKKKKRKKGDF